MIGKISKGASGRGLMRYVFGPGKANEHRDQRVIASGVALWAEEGRTLSTQEITDLGASLDAANDSYGKNPTGGHIWHVSLSLPPGDRPVIDEEWGEIASSLMVTLGFEGEIVAPAAWVAVGHGASAQGNQHLHIAASLVRLDGSRVEVWQDRKTLSRACAEFERAYGLTIVEGRDGKGMPGLSKAELERTAREHLAEPPRITLARLVREASVASKDEAEFVRRLRGSGALVRPRFETGGQEAVVGYSVALRSRAGDTPTWFGGGKLAKDLTLPHLREFWEVSKDDRKAAVVEWIAAKTVAPGREALRGHPDDWRRAVAAVERSVERLRVVPVSDLAVWRGAAREAAGVFAAWSRRLERNGPGPLAATADTLARSAQNGPGEPTPDRGAVRDFRGVAAIVAQSQLGRDSPIAWAMLIDQMGRTLRAIADAHAARGEFNTAKVLVDTLSTQIAALHDRFETNSIQELALGERVYEGRFDAAMSKNLPHQAKHHRGRGQSPSRGVGR
jgi:AcrR family transcriptional regulator